MMFDILYILTLHLLAMPLNFPIIITFLLKHLEFCLGKLSAMNLYFKLLRSIILNKAQHSYVY